MTDATTTLHPDHIASLVEGRHPRPHDALGVHDAPGGSVVRVIRPLASAVTAVLADGGRVDLEHVDSGLWQGATDAAPQAYTVEAAYGSDSWTTEDPYRFSPTVGEIDLYLWGEGRHEQIWEALGARHLEHEGVSGVAFSVWAPHAQAVRVIGDFNGWDGASCAARRPSR